MKRIEFLQSAITQSDFLDHSKSDQMFDLVAQYWSLYLSTETGSEIDLCSVDVPALIALMKMAHAQVMPSRDAFIDGMNYVAIAGEMYHKHSTLTPKQ